MKHYRGMCLVFVAIVQFVNYIDLVLICTMRTIHESVNIESLQVPVDFDLLSHLMCGMKCANKNPINSITE